MTREYALETVETASDATVDVDDDDAKANYIEYAKCIQHYLMRQIILNDFHKNVLSTFHGKYDPYYYYGWSPVSSLTHAFQCVYF